MGNEEAKLLITGKLNVELKRKFNGIRVSFVNDSNCIHQPSLASFIFTHLKLSLLHVFVLFI